MHPRRVRPDHGVHLPHGHPGGHSPQVPQPHLLHPLLPKPLHAVALGGHRRGLPGHAALHGGVEQRAFGPARPRRQREEGGVTGDGGAAAVEADAAVERIRSFLQLFAQKLLRQAVLKKRLVLFCIYVDNLASGASREYDVNVRGRPGDRF